MRSHVNSIFSVAFSPDGQTLASGSLDNTIILWDVATGQPVGEPLTGHTDSVYSVTFSPDGQTLASGSGDNTIFLWDIGLDSWKDRACRIANRNLTQAEWDQYVGSEIPYTRTCPNLPSGQGAPPDAPASIY
jgi:WD40 repeat protein